MSVDIKTIVYGKDRIGKHFSLQLDECTDISKNVQLLANVRLWMKILSGKTSYFAKH